MPKPIPSIVIHRKTGEIVHHDQGAEFLSQRAAERFRKAQDDRRHLITGQPITPVEGVWKPMITKTI